MSKSLKALLLTGCLAGFLISGLVALHFGPDCYAGVWTQTTWEGGPGQELWSDTTMYYTNIGMDWESSPGDLMLRYPGWENTGELVGALIVPSIIQAFDGTLYAGVYPDGDVFQSTDAGTTWVNTGELAGAEEVCALLQAWDGAIYAGEPGFPSFTGRVYKTTDGGATWVETGDLPDAGDIYELIQAQDGAIYASGDIPSHGAVFKTTNGGLTWALTGDMPGTLHTWTVFQAADGIIYAGADCESAFWTTDGGGTWNLTGPVGWTFAFCQDSEGALYAGTRRAGGARVFKSVDAGTTWVEMGLLPGAYDVQTLLHAPDGTIYAGTIAISGQPGAVFRSMDAGTTWVQTGDLAGASGVEDLLQASDGTIYAATFWNGDVFRWSPPQGELVSSVYDAGPSPEYGIMSWDEILNGQTLVMKVRTDTLSDMSTAPDWTSCPPAVNGDDISSLSSVEDGDPYIQYRVEMVSSTVDSTPVLHEIRIEYSPTGAEELSNDHTLTTPARLYQNYPNPCREFTIINYQIPRSRRGDGERGRGGEESQIPDHTSHITLTIYDVSGRLVRTLIDEPFNHIAIQPSNRVVWDGTDGLGRRVPSGIYFCKLRITPEDGWEGVGFGATRKMVLMK